MTVTLMRADSGIVTNTKSMSKAIPHKDEQEQPETHHLVYDVKAQVDEYALQNWDFPSEETRKDFVGQNVSSVASHYFPSALDDRIFLVSRLLVVLFLIAESLLPFDADDGEEYIEALEAAVKGYWQPDESIPAIWMLCSVFDEVRAQDYLLADDIIDTAFSHLRGGLVRRGRSTQRQGTGSSSSSFRVGASLLSSLEPLAMGTNGSSVY